MTASRATEARRLALGNGRFGAWAGIAVGDAEGPLWVRLGPLSRCAAAPPASPRPRDPRFAPLRFTRHPNNRLVGPRPASHSRAQLTSCGQPRRILAT